MTDTTTTTAQIYRVYIRATPEAIWEAITSPDWNDRYGYSCKSIYGVTPGSPYQALANEGMVQMGTPEVVVDGEIIEFDPPRRLVHTYRFHFTPEMVAEGFTTLTYEIEAEHDGITSLMVTHDVTGAPITAATVDGTGHGKLAEGGGGWPWILSGLKTLLESGSAL